MYEDVDSFGVSLLFGQSIETFEAILEIQPSAVGEEVVHRVGNGRLDM